MKFLIAIIAVFFSAQAVFGMQLIAGHITADGQSENLLFLWDSPSSTTVDYSAGDDTGTANGTVQITGGAVLTTDTGTDGEDFYAFDISSNDIIDATGTGTIFVRFEATTVSASFDSVISFRQDFNDYLFLDIHTDGEVRLIYYSGTQILLTHGTTISTGTTYWIRITFDDSNPYMKLALFVDSGGSIGSEIGAEVTNTTDDWPDGTAFGANSFKVGNGKAVNAVFEVFYMAVYDDIRATEP